MNRITPGDPNMPPLGATSLPGFSILLNTFEGPPVFQEMYGLKPGGSFCNIVININRDQADVKRVFVVYKDSSGHSIMVNQIKGYSRKMMFPSSHYAFVADCEEIGKGNIAVRVEIAAEPKWEEYWLELKEFADQMEEGYTLDFPLE